MQSHQLGTSSNPTATVYLAPDVFDEEQERIFRGRTWCLLGIADDVPEFGHFVSANVGTTPVVLNRGADGLHAFVNRCAHQGALVVRQARGRVDKHVCKLHRWTYDHAGNLLEGGDCKVRLRNIRTDSYRGIVFGSFDALAPDLHAYMTESVQRHMDRLCSRPLKALSRHRCSIKANWKLYVERLRSTRGQFGIFPLYGDAVHYEHAGYHGIWKAYSEKNGTGEYRSILHRVEVEGGSGVPFFPEQDDGIASTVLYIFPAFILTKIENHLQIRQLVPKSANEFEMVWTNCAYLDDSVEQVQTRQIQGRLLGFDSPLSLEDAAELEAAHAALRNGLHGAEPATPPSSSSSIEFWTPYRDLMKD